MKGGFPQLATGVSVYKYTNHNGRRFNSRGKPFFLEFLHKGRFVTDILTR